MAVMMALKSLRAKKKAVVEAEIVRRRF